MSTWQPYHTMTFSVPTLDDPVVLGVSAYFHDSSAALAAGGFVAAAVEEERFTRRKHESGFPRHAIDFCLTKADRSPDLVVYYENPDRKFERVENTLARFPHSIEMQTMIRQGWSDQKSKARLQAELAAYVGGQDRVIFLDHHLSHAASAYLTSGADEAVIVTIDGVGETTTTAIGVGAGRDITMLRKIEFPHSIGLFYTALTVFLGFRALDGEYRVMGLAAYGEMRRAHNRFYRKLAKAVLPYPDGSYALDMIYFGHERFDEGSFTGHLEDLLGIRSRRREEPIEAEHRELAAATQLITEDLVFGVLNSAYDLNPSDALCFAGGVALNAVLNGKIARNTKFKSVFVPPAAGDAGTSLGAARYVQVQSDTAARRGRLRHAYLGPGYDETDIERTVRSSGLNFVRFKSSGEMLAEAARRIQGEAIVGWFQGSMEWGPRALGARSILADPTRANMQARLNKLIKHREPFRPFAPVVCAEHADRYFRIPQGVSAMTPFMLATVEVREEFQGKLPAVTHVDGTARVQIVSREANPVLHALLLAFAAISEVPILVNTSFNVDGEPIVATPDDALRCMTNAGLDGLFIGQFLVTNSNVEVLRSHGRLRDN